MVFIPESYAMNKVIRKKIILEYSKWCAFSSLRSGAPVKKRDVIYPKIDAVSFGLVLDGRFPIAEKNFNNWHQNECIKLAKNLGDKHWIGWASKIINIYLKTACYIGGLGRKGLVEVIHPPLDGILAKALENKVSIPRIKEIKSYDQYIEIIDLIKIETNKQGISLFEIEKEWKIIRK
jgi:hypothetical protein